jgi:ammonium transporter
MKADVDAVAKTAGDLGSVGIHKYADVSWMLVSSALVMLMMPGLALFYGGMARRKNVLGTMMHTMIALGLVGVQWVVIGYALAFGDPLYEVSISKDDKGEPIKAGVIGFSKELVGLGTTAAVGMTEDEVKKAYPALTGDELAKKVADVNRFKTFPNTNVPLYLHAMFQGMFAIITVALVSGAFAERVKFGTYLLFALIWTTVVYDPLAHMVWSIKWAATDAEKVAVPLTSPEVRIAPAAGLLGANGAIDFAGGTVVHIAAGFSGLAAVLVLRKRIGYGKQTFHPNSMVITLLGAGLLWFGWFGFNGGSALFANGQAVSAFTVTQIAAATAGLAWTIVEWLHRGKPTGLGFASGLVAGLVAITPASGFVDPVGALIIGVVAGVACYWMVAAKALLGYDDSLDAFGIHGVGGLIGAVLTGLLVSLPLWVYGSEMPAGAFPGKTVVDEAAKTVVFDRSSQLLWQIKASAISAVYAFVVTGVLVLVLEYTVGFTLSPKDEAAGLDLSQHGEVGFDMGPDVDAGAVVEPKAALAPPANGGGKRFTVVVDGPPVEKLMIAWSKLCQTGEHPPAKEFRDVYPFVTTVAGNRFRFRGGDPVLLKDRLKKLFEDALGGAPVKTYVES